MATTRCGKRHFVGSPVSSTPWPYIVLLICSAKLLLESFDVRTDKPSVCTGPVSHMT
jgi:hypothetical protein